MDADLLVTPLGAVVVEEAGAVHLTRWTAPVQSEGQRQPAGLRAQLFLPDIVRPTAARLTDGILAVFDQGDLPPMPASLRSALEARLNQSGAKPLPLVVLRAGEKTALAAALKELAERFPTYRRDS